MAKVRKSNSDLNHTEIESPLGKIIIGEHKGKICVVDFKGERTKNTLKNLSRKHGVKLNRQETPTLKAAKKQLSLYLSGRLIKFDLPLDYVGTGFQKSIWRQLEKIPFGKTVSYGDIAEKIGRPGAARAVGAAVGSNRISIIIPCHRVIGKDGSMTGYGGGLRKKEWLLAHERAI